jgi:ABC-type Zn uptake system ZnuABC Zn-binding protein ZnuA
MLHSKKPADFSRLHFLDIHGMIDVVISMIKRFLCILTLFLFILTGCSETEQPSQIVATTLPVYEFSAILCEGTDLHVTLLITENVSCLHDYTLNVRQVKAAEQAEVIILSGMGLEDFMNDILLGEQTVIDSSTGIDALHCEQDHDHEHAHEDDPHIWLSPANAKTMAHNICIGLSTQYPEYASVFSANLQTLIQELDTLESYGRQQLAALQKRELLTFHDGFSYFAKAFDLEILEAVEEESGSEASAAELIRLIQLVQSHALPAIFTEQNGSTSAARIISRETSAGVFCLDMAMSEKGYFEAMYHNINTVKEALQ